MKVLHSVRKDQKVIRGIFLFFPCMMVSVYRRRFHLSRTRKSLLTEPGKVLTGLGQQVVMESSVNHGKGARDFEQSLSCSWSDGII